MLNRRRDLNLTIWLCTVPLTMLSPLRHVCETTQYITICLCALFHCPCCSTQTCMWNNPIYHNMSMCTVPLTMLSHSDMWNDPIYHNMSVHCSTVHVVPLRHVCEMTQYILYITICLCTVPLPMLFHSDIWNDPIYIGISTHMGCYSSMPNVRS